MSEEMFDVLAYLVKVNSCSFECGDFQTYENYHTNIVSDKPELVLKLTEEEYSKYRKAITRLNVDPHKNFGSSDLQLILVKVLSKKSLDFLVGDALAQITKEEEKRELTKKKKEATAKARAEKVALTKADKEKKLLEELKEKYDIG